MNIKVIAGFCEKAQRIITQRLIDGETQQSVADDLNTSRGSIKRINEQMRPILLAEAVKVGVDSEFKKVSEETTEVLYNPENVELYLDGDNITDLIYSPPKQDVQPSSFTLVPNSIINIMHNNEVYTADYTHPRFNEIVGLCVDGIFDVAVELVDVAKAITKYSEGDITIDGETILYKGQEVHDGLATKIIELMQQGDEGFKKYVKFMSNLRLNPSFRAVTELFGFISYSDIEIDEDGYLLAWKFVTPKFLDTHTHQVQNYIGNTIRMERNMVNENKDETCSQGLHVCAWDYKFSSTAVRVRLHPKDVVSIPSDYSNQKLRCAEYEVLYAVDMDKDMYFADDRYTDDKIITVGEQGAILDIQEK